MNIDRCFNISSTIEDLGEYLRLMPDDSYITLEAYKHATTLIKKNGTYIFYDPNEPRGELTFESPKELSRTIFEFYDRVKKEGTKTSKIQLEINFLSFNRPDARMQKYAGKKKQFRIDSEKYFSKYAAFEKRFIADFSAHEKRYAGKARRGSVVSPVRRDDASRGDVAKYVINLRTIEHIKMSVRDKHFTLPIDERDDAHSYSVKHHELISQMIQDNDFDAIKKMHPKVFLVKNPTMKDGTILGLALKCKKNKIFEYIIDEIDKRKCLGGLTADKFLSVMDNKLPSTWAKQLNFLSTKLDAGNLINILTDISKASFDKVLPKIDLSKLSDNSNMTKLIDSILDSELDDKEKSKKILCLIKNVHNYDAYNNVDTGSYLVDKIILKLPPTIAAPLLSDYEFEFEEEGVIKEHESKKIDEIVALYKKTKSVPLSKGAPSKPLSPEKLRETRDSFKALQDKAKSEFDKKSQVDEDYSPPSPSGPLTK